MDTNEVTRRFQITKTENGRFILTGKRGATYIATAAFIGNDDTMKLVGGLTLGTTSIARNRYGQELHVSRRALEEFAN